MVEVPTVVAWVPVAARGRRHEATEHKKAPAPLAEASVAEVENPLGGNKLPHIAAEPTILPPAIAVAVVAIASAVVPYLLDRAALDGTGLQRLKHARCRRSVGRGHRETERSAQRSDRQQLSCHDVVPPSPFQSAAYAARERDSRRNRKRTL